MKFITNNRVWVEMDIPEFPLTRGLYLIKEDGEWKTANFLAYAKRVKEDLEVLGKAIKDYYAVTQELPEILYDLLGLKSTKLNNIPLDLFNDDNEHYVYKIINKNTYKLYSLGPDSDDDQGMVEWKSGVYEIGDGDIIKTDSLL